MPLFFRGYLERGVAVKALEKMPGHPRPCRRGAVYCHRAIDPKDLAHAYPEVEETFSLTTKEHAEALRRVRVASVEVDQKIEAHSRKQALASKTSFERINRASPR